MLTRYIHNSSGSTKTYAGHTLTNGVFYPIPENLIFEFATNDLLLTDLAAGTVFMSQDGTTNMTGVSSQIDFLKNGVVEPTDESDQPIVTVSAMPVDWHYQLLTTEVSTSALLGLYCKDSAGSDNDFISIKIYNASGVEITTTLGQLLATSTVMYVRPTHDYHFLGAATYQVSRPINDVRLWLTGSPGYDDIVYTAGSVNMRYVGDTPFRIADGRSGQVMTYNASAADQNAIKIVIKYPVGTQHTFQLSFEMYKEL